MKKRLTLECNAIQCGATWHLDVDPDRVIGNRLMGLEFCPVCGRYDSPYIIDVEKSLPGNEL
jgi:hypothetical protein